LIWGNDFRDLGLQRGSLRPRARRVAVLGVGAGGGRSFSLRGSGGVTPGNFFEIFNAKCRVWEQFGSEIKLIEGQPNEYDVICQNASVLAFHLWPTIFAGAPFRLQNSRSGSKIFAGTAFHRVPAPLHHYTTAAQSSLSRPSTSIFQVFPLIQRTSAVGSLKVRSTSTPSYLRCLVQDRQHSHNL